MVGAAAAGRIAGGQDAHASSPTTGHVHTGPTTVFVETGPTAQLEAERVVRETVPSIMSYEAARSTYAGMTIALLRARYDRTIPSGEVWVNPAEAGYPRGVHGVVPTRQAYCLIARVGRWYAWKHDAAGIIEHSTRAARVCNF